MAQKLQITPLGGLGEIGKNMTVYEYGRNMIIVDCGVKFPDNDMYGIDLVLPDFEYVVQNQDRLRGIILTHGHMDHIAALPYLLRQIAAPIYGTPLTLGLVERQLKEKNVLDRADQHSRKNETVHWPLTSRRSPRRIPSGSVGFGSIRRWARSSTPATTSWTRRQPAGTTDLDSLRALTKTACWRWSATAHADRPGRTETERRRRNAGPAAERGAGTARDHRHLLVGARPPAGDHDAGA